MDLKSSKTGVGDSGNRGNQPDAHMPLHALTPLPYDYVALEPCIDARTMTLHHDKHPRPGFRQRATGPRNRHYAGP